MAKVGQTRHATKERQLVTLAPFQASVFNAVINEAGRAVGVPPAST